MPNMGKEERMDKINRKIREMEALRKCLPTVSTVTSEETNLFRFYPGNEIEKIFSLSDREYNGSNEYLETCDNMSFYLTNTRVIVRHELSESWYFIDEFNKKHLRYEDVNTSITETFYSLNDIFR